MSTYWKCNQELSDKIHELFKPERDMFKAAKNLAKEIGAETEGFAASRSWGNYSTEGFFFSEPPGKGFYKSKEKTTNGKEIWIPRAGTKIRKRMNELSTNCLDDVCKLIEFEAFRGLSFCTPGINRKGKSYYIVLDDKATQTHPGMTRISDMEFEKVFKGRIKK